MNHTINVGLRKREERALMRYKQQNVLVDQYQTHHKQVIDLVNNTKAIKSMFNKQDSEQQRPKITTYNELEQLFGKLNYTDIEMKSTMLLICQSILESIAIEKHLEFQSNAEMVQYAKFKPLLEKVKQSTWFNSLEQYRYKFHHYKSGQYLNYWKADTTPAILGDDYIRFHSTTKDSSEYINRFKTSFESYQKDPDHIILGLSIVQTLLQCSKYTPTIEIWTYLLSQFQRFNLDNFATIIYISLFHYKHQPTVLAKHPQMLTAPIMPDHFTHLIQVDPEILGPIFTYQARHQDLETAVDLLAFLQLDRVIKEKHPYMWARSGIHFIRIPQTIFVGPELTISRQCMYTIMRACLDLKLYSYFGLLFDKILVNSLDLNRIKLNTGNYKLVENLFDEELCILWFEYCKDTVDSKAVGWLLTYFLPKFLERQGQFSDKFKSEFKQMMILCDYEMKYQELSKKYGL
ncbi:hypothetical protein JA1_004434 [Spathaspora sp. JA1]|nr:hypothetical protein JA1_004434 [Spathaspora sp. JA1]